MKFLPRRTVLRGLGGIAIALPFLDAMVPARRIWAQSAQPKRLLVWFQPGGTEIADWRPRGTETNFAFSAMMQPLEKHKQNLIVLDGLSLSVTREGNGHPHSRGMGGLLTGEILPSGTYNTNGGNAGFSRGTSIDQFIAQRITAGRKFKSLEMAVRWPSDGTDGLQVHPWNTIIYSAPGQPVPPQTVPRKIFDRLFTDLGGNTDTGQKRTKSILDAALEEYRILSSKLGPSDRQRLEAHMSALRSLETSIAAGMSSSNTCSIPNFGNELDLPSAAGSDEGGDGYVDSSKDQAIPRTGRLMMDMMAMAMACDLTRVGTLQWADSQSNNSFPWLNLNDTHHGYQHDRGYNPGAIRTINNWYASQFSYLLDKLAAVSEGTGTLLDNTVVLSCTEIRHPNEHSQDNMPFILAGKAGGYFKTGRWVKYTNRAHNDLLVSIQNAFGFADQSYGRAGYSTGALSGLT